MDQDYKEKKHHLDLLKLKYSKEKPLSREDSLEFHDYSVLLDSHFDWEIRDQYLQLF